MASSSSNAAPAASKPSDAVAIVCVGMAGSGKTTFMQRINSHLHQQKDAPYVVNLDPAVRTVPFEPNIDIRDSVNYKEVMKQYRLGPNGGILTSLNLFATKIDQILALLEKRTAPPPTPKEGENSTQQISKIIVDTPGQIEVFVWSASGDILLNSLASSFPTVLAYIIDTPRTASVSTFMSNMLYACSILYKTKLPMILVCNKTDVKDADFIKEWMTDFEAFQDSLRAEEDSEDGYKGGGSGYMGSLLNSMSLVLEEFYSHLSVVGVSSMTGEGVEEFFNAVQAKAEEFERDYRPELERRRQQRDQEKKTNQERDLERLLKDMNVEATSKKGKPKKPEPETVSDIEDTDEDEDGGLVEPDEEEYEEDNGAEEGLAKRYKQALSAGTPGEKPGDDDMSFARYIQHARMG